MIPTSFDEANDVLSAPDGISPNIVGPLNVLKTEILNGPPTVISCWKITQEEVGEIQRTGRIWLMVMGTTMPPVQLCGIKPFVCMGEINKTDEDSDIAME